MKKIVGTLAVLLALSMVLYTYSGDKVKELEDRLPGIRGKEDKDANFNEKSRQRIVDMQVKYETEKKEKESELLEKEKKIRELEVSRQRDIRNFLIAVCVLIFLLAIVIYYSYRLKVKGKLELKEEIYHHRQTETKLRESEEKFRILAEKSQIGIFIVQDEHFKYVNPRFAEIFGYGVEEIVGKKHPSDLIFKIEKAPKTERLNILNPDLKVTRKDGETVYIEVYGSSILFRDRDALLGTVLDITERKSSERERLKNRNLESIGVLAGGIAHDFNNLLSVILGNISILKEMVPSGGEHFHLLDIADHASMQAANLAGKLLTFSRGDILIRNKLELSPVLEQAININMGTDLRQYAFELDIPDSLLPIYGDERQLLQVFSNLVSNACDAMPLGGTIFIQAENITLNAGNEFGLASGQFIHTAIKDEGAGIPDDIIGKIFDPYFSTRYKGTQKGMGMGLTVCYSILGKHKGHIRVKSREGKGTVVDVYLPAFSIEAPLIEEEVREPEASGAVPLEKEAPVSKPKAKVLFMDDEESVCTINREMLNRMGFDVACAREGHEALEAYKRAKRADEGFDIVILDIINYIGMGGKEALQHITAFDPGVKSIAISGFLRNTDIEDLEKAGFDDVLFKPYKPSQLETVIKKLLP